MGFTKRTCINAKVFWSYAVPYFFFFLFWQCKFCCLLWNPLFLLLLVRNFKYSMTLGFFFRYIWDTFTCSGLKTFEISVVVQLFIIAICSPMEERGIYFVCLILLVWIFYSLIRPPFDWFLVLKLNHTTLHCTASIPWLFHNLMIIFEEFSLIACDAS